jgi:hypothetical protein
MITKCVSPFGIYTRGKYDPCKHWNFNGTRILLHVDLHFDKLNARHPRSGFAWLGGFFKV